MTPAKHGVICEFEGDPMERSSSLADLKEKVLAWSLGTLISLLCLIGIWVGGQIKTMSSNLQDLNVSMARILVMQSVDRKDVDQVKADVKVAQADIAALKTDAAMHAREDRRRFVAPWVAPHPFQPKEAPDGH